jgi:hypothetical protein
MIKIINFILVLLVAVYSAGCGDSSSGNNNNTGNQKSYNFFSKSFPLENNGSIVDVKINFNIDTNNSYGIKLAKDNVSNSVFSIISNNKLEKNINDNITYYDLNLSSSPLELSITIEEIFIPELSITYLGELSSTDKVGYILDNQIYNLEYDIYTDQNNKLLIFRDLLFPLNSLNSSGLMIFIKDKYFHIKFENLIYQSSNTFIDYEFSDELLDLIYNSSIIFKEGSKPKSIIFKNYINSQTIYYYNKNNDNILINNVFFNKNIMELQDGDVVIIPTSNIEGIITSDETLFNKYISENNITL